MQAASDVVKGRTLHLCLRPTAPALPLLARNQQICFVSNLTLGAVDQFCLHAALLGEETTGRLRNSTVCIWHTGSALDGPATLCNDELFPKADSCLKLPPAHFLSVRTIRHYLARAAAQLRCGNRGRAATAEPWSLRMPQGWEPFFQRVSCHVLVDILHPDLNLWTPMSASPFGSKAISCDINAAEYCVLGLSLTKGILFLF